MCFLEREVYAFLSTFDKRGERVRGAMPRARIFFCLWEGRRRRRGQRAMDRPQMGRGRHTRRAYGQGSAGRAARKRPAEKGKKDVFLFLEEKSEGYLLCPPSESRGRSVAIAALGRGLRRENDVCANCGTGWETQLVEGCGLWPRTQLIDLRYLCESAEREKRMDVCFLLTLYI